MFVNLICGWCNKPIKVLKGEYTRQVKNGRKFFFCIGDACQWFNGDEWWRWGHPRAPSYNAFNRTSTCLSYFLIRLHSYEISNYRW